MKLKDNKRAPVGGWYYKYTIKRGNLTFPATVYGESLDKLIANTKKDMLSNSYHVPEDLAWQVEDQICQRQPGDRCWYEPALGDTIASVIHGAAKLTDKVLGTKLEHRARGCSSCNKRRAALNKLS
jgi:hypothetical protein